jgi:hypothetical protein
MGVDFVREAIVYRDESFGTKGVFGVVQASILEFVLASRSMFS